MSQLVFDPSKVMDIDYTKRTEYLDGLAAIKAAHKVLKEITYTPSLPDKGYTNRTLYVNVGSLEITEKPVTQQMKDVFIGGRGFGLYHLWNAVKPTTRWNDPENEIIISPGPVAGMTQYAGTGKSLVVSLSPQTDIPIDSNVGGFYGPLLKFSGFDALELQGKSDKDIILFIDGLKGIIRIEEAPTDPVDSHVLAEVLTHMYAENEKDLPNISVVSTGAAAEHSLIGMLNFSFYDRRRKCVRFKQAGRGGIGTVFRDKRIRALVVRGPKVAGDLNHPADPETIAKTGIKFHKEIRENDGTQCMMRRNGTAHIVEIMDAYDLLPVHNFQFGSHPDVHKIDSSYWQQRCTQHTVDGCWYGCSMACAKGADGLVLKTGPYKGHMVTVDGPEYENAAGLGSNCGVFDPDYLLELNFYCDTYGICTITYGTLTAFVMECYQRGILNKERTGGLEMTWGNAEADLEMMHQMARGEGFGKIAGLGVKKMKELLHQERLGRPPAHQRHRHGEQGPRILPVHVQGIPGPAGRLRPHQQGPPARRGLADLHGHGEQAAAHVRGQGRSALLLPPLPHLVRPQRLLQAALERRGARRQLLTSPRPTRCPSMCRTTWTSSAPPRASRSARKT